MGRMSELSRRILAVETSGRTGSVAVGSEAGVAAAATLSGEMRHASELLPAIGRLIAGQGWRADAVTDVFLSIGPGSFTGLRIGVALARTLAWSIGARITAVPTMGVLARNALEADPVPAHVAILLDAKRSEVYGGCFAITAGRCVRLIDACLVGPSVFLERCPRPLAVLGEGVPHHREAVDRAGVALLPDELWAGRAEHVLELGLILARDGRTIEGRDLLPHYIRRPEAEEKWRRLHPERFPAP